MLTNSLKIAALTFSERVKAKLASDFEQGFRIEVVEHDRLSLPDLPEWLTDSIAVEAGFISQTEAGETIEVGLYESKHQSSSLPRAIPETTEVHDLTFSLRSPTGEELAHVLVDKPRGNIQVQGVKMTAPLINVCGLQLRPRLDQGETGDFFERYLGSSVDLEATRRQFEERREDHENELRGNARMYQKGSGQITVSQQGMRFQISRKNEVIFPNSEEE